MSNTVQMRFKPETMETGMEWNSTGCYIQYSRDESKLTEDLC